MQGMKGDTKMFINNKFKEAIACAGMKIREDHYDYIETIFDEITPYGWECHCEYTQRMECENTSEVLKRRFGRPNNHRAYGFCFNPTL